MIAQTIPSGAAVAEAIVQGYALGDLQHCELLRSGFNHVFRLKFVDGRRAIARLSDHRPSGAPNSDYETAFLHHLRNAKIEVAASIPTRDHSPAIQMHLPEGPRTLMLFEHLDGETPDTLPDIEATGRGLALLHEAGTTYKGPTSRYVLDLPLLLDASIKRICAISTANDALRASFIAIGQRLTARIAAIPNLTYVTCHGDCHGDNNFMTEDKEGTRVPTFFDFDDAGPGLLSYELSVFLLSMRPGKVEMPLEDFNLENWRAFLKGYRSVRALESNDFDAIAPFISVRQFWLMGEYAGRIAVWGTETISTNYLQKQVNRFLAWESLTTPS